MKFNFESIGNSNKVGYEFNSSDFSYGDGKGLCDQIKQFDTYGDNGIQHSPSYAVQSVNYLDCTLSLISYFNENISILEDITFYLRDIPKDEIQFFNDLKYKEGKIRYYSVKDNGKCKVTTSESKRHDKRYEEIPTWANGDLYSLFRFLSNEYIHGYASVFDYLNLFYQIQKGKDDFYWNKWSIEETQINLFGVDSDQLYELYNAFTHLKRLLEVGKILYHSKRRVRSYLEKLEYEKANS